MYRCQICQSVTQPRQPRRVHAVKRHVPYTRFTPGVVAEQSTRTETEREVAVCCECEEALKVKSLKQVCRERARVLVRLPKPKKLRLVRPTDVEPSGAGQLVAVSVEQAIRMMPEPAVPVVKVEPALYMVNGRKPVRPTSRRVNK